MSDNKRLTAEEGNPTNSRWKSFCTKFWKVFDDIIKYLAYIPAGGLLFISFMIVADVICRYVFNSPFKNTTPLAELILVLVLAFGGPWLLHNRGFITVDMVVTRLPYRARQILACITDLISGLVFGFVGYYAALKAIELIKSRAIIINSGGNWLHAVYAVPLVCFYFILAIQYFRNAVYDVLALKSEVPEPVTNEIPFGGDN